MKRRAKMPMWTFVIAVCLVVVLCGVIGFLLWCKITTISKHQHNIEETITQLSNNNQQNNTKRQTQLDAIMNLIEELAENRSILQQNILTVQTTINQTTMQDLPQLTNKVVKIENVINGVFGEISLPQLQDSIQFVQNSVIPLSQLPTAVSTIETTMSRLPEIQADMSKISDLVIQLPDLQNQIAKINGLAIGLPKIKEEISSVLKIIEQLPTIQQQVEQIQVLAYMLPKIQSQIETINMTIANVPQLLNQIDAAHKILDELQSHSQKINSHINNIFQWLHADAYTKLPDLLKSNQNNRLAIAIDFENYFCSFTNNGKMIWDVKNFDELMNFLITPHDPKGYSRNWNITSKVVYTNRSRWRPGRGLFGDHRAANRSK
jgi:hypothetical protein